MIISFELYYYTLYVTKLYKVKCYDIDHALMFI